MNPRGRRIAIVTGANAGIGRALAMGLAQRDFRVVLACRRRSAALQAAHEIGERTGVPVETLIVDLARTGSVREAALEALARFPRIDVLALNAAVWSVDRRLTEEGRERTWATNVLGHHLLLRLLTERLVETAPARVVVVASGLAHSLDLDDPHFAMRRYRGIAAYAQSKQAGRMLARAYARELSPRGVTVNSMHPGFTRTSAFGNGGGLQGRIAGLGALLFGQSPERAADTALWLATSDEVRDVSGGYFQDRTERGCPFSDPAREERLLALVDRETGAASALACRDGHRLAAGAR